MSYKTNVIMKAITAGAIIGGSIVHVIDRFDVVGKISDHFLSDKLSSIGDEISEHIVSLDNAITDMKERWVDTLKYPPIPEKEATKISDDLIMIEEEYSDILFELSAISVLVADGGLRGHKLLKRVNMLTYRINRLKDIITDEKASIRHWYKEMKHHEELAAEELKKADKETEKKGTDESYSDTAKKKPKTTTSKPRASRTTKTKTDEPTATDKEEPVAEDSKSTKK